MQSREWFTVVDVFRELGMEPTPHHTWSAGAAAREAYKQVHGTLPVKDNRTKTSGKGSHCFALYPPTWRDRIREIVRAQGAERAKQGDLFE